MTESDTGKSPKIGAQVRIFALQVPLYESQKGIFHGLLVRYQNKVRG